VFVLPALADQGVPAGFAFRVFHPVLMQPNAESTSLAVEEGRVVLKGLLPGVPKPAVIAVEAGRLTSIDLGGVDTLEALTEAEAEALRGR
jgi:hypothetical protein